MTHSLDGILAEIDKNYASAATHGYQANKLTYKSKVRKLYWITTRSLEVMQTAQGWTLAPLLEIAGECVYTMLDTGIRDPWQVIRDECDRMTGDKSINDFLEAVSTHVSDLYLSDSCASCKQRVRESATKLAAICTQAALHDSQLNDRMRG